MADDVRLDRRWVEGAWGHTFLGVRIGPQGEGARRRAQIPRNQPHRRGIRGAYSQGHQVSLGVRDVACASEGKAEDGSVRKAVMVRPNVLPVSGDVSYAVFTGYASYGRRHGASLDVVDRIATSNLNVGKRLAWLVYTPWRTYQRNVIMRRRQNGKVLLERSA